jgi:hypothetical protein
MSIVLAFLACVGAENESYLLRVDRALQLCAADIPALQQPAETAAARLANGGKLWAAGQPSWVSELTGRAGGLMMMKPLAGKKPGDGDVILYAPDGTSAPDFGNSYVISVASKGSGGGVCVYSHADEAGIGPTLANAIPGWIFTGELIAALTRLGKMPVIYESIGAYGGNARIAQYKDGAIAFHDAPIPPPVPHGVIGKRFVETISTMLRRIETEQHSNLDTAGRWAREAKAGGHTLYMYSMGHLFPDEVGKTDIGKMFKSAVWNAGFRTSAPPDDAYQPGDFAVHVGYQHPPSLMLERITRSGAKAAYMSVLPDRDYAQNPNVTYIDPMWNWADACVPLEAYDVPLLAASGIVHGAIAWEIYRLAK